MLNNLKIILKFLAWSVCFCWFFSSYALTQISLSSDSEAYDIEDVIELRIEIVSDEGWSLRPPRIPWIENFNMLGNSQSLSTRSLNWKKTVNLVLIMTFVAKESGAYDIWPISVNGTESNSLKLIISWERILLGWQPTAMPWTPSQNTISNQKTDDKEIDKEQEIDEEKIISSLKQKQWEIRDIRWKWSVDLLNYKNTLVLLVFIILFFSSRYLFLHIGASIVARREEREKNKKVFSDFFALLEKFEDRYLDSSKDIFYSKLSELTRRYMAERIDVHFPTLTLSEMKKQAQNRKELIQLYEKIYYPEYNYQKDTKEERIYLLNELRDELN